MVFLRRVHVRAQVVEAAGGAFVGGAAQRVGQNVVGFLQRHEGGGIAGDRDVRVQHPRFASIGGMDRFRGGIPVELKPGVVALRIVVHWAGILARLSAFS